MNISIEIITSDNLLKNGSNEGIMSRSAWSLENKKRLLVEIKRLFFRCPIAPYDLFRFISDRNQSANSN